MNGFNFCDSCGYKLSADSLFCPRCGQKVEPVQIPETPAPAVMPQQDSDGINQPIEEKQTGDSTSCVQGEQIINEVKPESNEPVPEPIEVAAPAEPEKPAIQQQSTYTTQPQPVQQMVYQPQQQPQPQQAISPQNIQQAPATQPQAAPVKKKKFPWVFTALWALGFIAVGIWAYFIFVDPNYDYPIFTEDAQRFVLFAACIAALLYTLSLKLTMKKLKGLPTVILVLLALVAFFFFCLVELQDGDFLHDSVVNIIESIS